MSNFRHVVQTVSSDDVSLHTEALLNGSMHAPPVILLSEAEAPSTRWPSELATGLAGLCGGVIWFDTRDCGRSSWPDEPYAIEDLVVDVLHVLDAYDVERAHVVGRSMGGQVAQQLALAMPQRLASLALLSSTPGRREEFGMPEDWLIDKMTERLFDDLPSGSVARAEWLVAQQLWFSGPVFEFDQQRALDGALAEVEMAWRGTNRHGEVVVDAPDIVDYLQHIVAPTLIVHGTADPVLPVRHAQALAERIPRSKLVLVEGLGHELPDAFVPQLLELMAELVVGR